MADKVIFRNIVGTFVFNNQSKVVESHKGDYVSEYQKKYKNADDPTQKQYVKILEFFREKEHLEVFRTECIKNTKQAIKASVSDANLLSQAVSSIDETERTINLYSKRLREWYALTAPEVVRNISDNKMFAELVLKRPRDQLLKEYNITDEKSAGKKLPPEDVKAYQSIAWQISGLFQLKKQQEEYIEKLMQRTFPNAKAVVGAVLAARIIQHVPSVDRLIRMPASTLQMLGAEKALFRHMKNKKKNPPPKYGLLFNHQLVQSAKAKERGKLARIIADKLSIALKVDYFKGKYIGDDLKNQVIEKARSLK